MIENFLKLIRSIYRKKLQLKKKKKKECFPRKIMMKAKMFTVMTLIKNLTGISSQCNNARKRKKT